MPIASNKSISGRSKNQRIEVWIRCPDLTQ
jgi:outer membrane protein OmpA-like peptidoglycan-associated protein